jgi:hypothetical protein
MSAWWESPYQGGPMVAVPGFPRPLYPPDAAPGQMPSVNGPDVEAYKRTVWRAGRWPGPASEFDRAYSNAFAHGRGGNVGESGVAGVQRQQGIEASGWVGEKTFNTLRSIRVPTGPHKGEMAMDANAANLIAQAWQLYGGEEPPRTPPVPPTAAGKTTRQRALEAAIGYLSYKESPPDSNNTKFGDWYGCNYQPWCAAFVTYCYEVDAGGSPSFDKTQNRYAYCPYVVSDARNNRFGLSVPSSPLPGDLVVYAWGSSGAGTEEFDHIGLFEGWVGGSTFSAIEGNTSMSNNSNGGEVMRRQRSTTGQGTEFVRVA